MSYGSGTDPLELKLPRRRTWFRGLQEYRSFPIRMKISAPARSAEECEFVLGDPRVAPVSRRVSLAEGSAWNRATLPLRSDPL